MSKWVKKRKNREQNRKQFKTADKTSYTNLLYLMRWWRREKEWNKKMILTWLTASSALRRISSILSSVCRRKSLIIDTSWCEAWLPAATSFPRFWRIEIAFFVFSAIPLIHDNIVCIFRHSSSPLGILDPLIGPPPAALNRLAPRFAVSECRSSRLLLLLFYIENNTFIFSW